MVPRCPKKKKNWFPSFFQWFIIFSLDQIILRQIYNELSIFVNYIYDEQTKIKFTKGKHTTKDIVEYVHVDLRGPTSTDSLGGRRYFLSDDFLRKVWTLILKRMKTLLPLSNGGQRLKKSLKLCKNIKDS